MRFLILLAALLAVACDAPAPPAATPAASPPVTDPAPDVPVVAAAFDREALTLTARRLAGLAAADASDAWARHAEAMDEIWARVEERHLAPMRAWAQDQLVLDAPEAPLYYPFGGPDLPSALQFFPEASSYVLIGLERPGRIPDLSGLEGAALDAELERLRGGLANLAEAGYFVTKRMESDFDAATRLEGFLPAFLIFLARAELAPVAIEFVRFAGDGQPVPLETATDRTATAARIRFTGAGESGVERSLYYVAQDLSDAGLAAAPAFEAFLRGLGDFNVYMKSASYLLHMEGFAAHRDFLVAQAGSILQDDSGIPLAHLPSADWRLTFFGTYERTLPTYREWFQEDLAAVFRQAGIAPLPFAIGYNSKIGGSCLIWAQRREE